MLFKRINAGHLHQKMGILDFGEPVLRSAAMTVLFHHPLDRHCTQCTGFTGTHCTQEKDLNDIRNQQAVVLSIHRHFLAKNRKDHFLLHVPHLEMKYGTTYKEM